MPLKTKDSRNIPITGSLYLELSVLIAKNSQGFIFSDTGGSEPISRNRVYKETGNAFDKIEITSEEREKRRIALHHWRHFLNTALLMANVNTLKVQKVTGHKSLTMTRHYAHFDSREFTEVLEVQNNLLPAAKLPKRKSKITAVISAVTEKFTRLLPEKNRNILKD
jgi:integrase